MSRRAWGLRRRRERELRLEQPLVQILVLVANIQMKTLKAEVGKGFMRTAIGHELLDPKAYGSSVY